MWGKKFSEGNLFVPDMLKPFLGSEGAANKGTVVIGMVKGNLHEIGKNLVSMMMEGAGFNVVDLGLDVDAVKFVAAKENDAAVVAAVDMDTKNGPRDLAIMQLLIRAGLRVGEVPRLAITNVVLQKRSGHVWVVDENTGSERRVPLNAPARRALHDYLAIRGATSGGDPLFISQRKKRISIQTVQFLAKKYLYAAGREDLSARDLRRHLACELFRKNKDLTVVQQILGHHNLATTVRYLQRADKDLSAILEDLPETIIAHQTPKE